MKLLNQNQAADYINSHGGKITRQGIFKWTQKKIMPACFVNQGGELLVDVDSPEFISRMEKNIKRGRKQERQPGEKLEETEEANETEQTEESERENKKQKKIRYPHTELPESERDLESQARIAEYQDAIFSARIKEEKAKQEEIKTAELKKELAPMYLIKHFFSFGENMIHRSYRINHEIIPELNALFLSGKLQEAEQLLNERQETIVKESQADLIKAVREEGYNYE